MGSIPFDLMGTAGAGRAHRPRIAGAFAAVILLAAGTALNGCSGAEQTAVVPVQSAARSDAEARQMPGEAVDSPLGSYLAGRLARADRDTARAADFFAQSLAEDPDNPALLRRTAVLLVGDGRIGEATQLAERLLRIDPREGLASLVLAVQEIREGRYAGAARRMEAVPRTGFSLLLAPMLTAWARYGDAGMDAAVAGLEPLRDNAAFAAFHHYHSALLYDLGDRMELAAQAYQAALTASGGGSLRVVEAYGNFLQRRQRPEEARKLYRDFLDRAPDNPVIGAALAGLDTGRPAGRMVASAADGAAEAMYGAASVLSREDGGDAGEAYAQLALHLRPDFALVQSLLADMYEASGRYAEAIQIYAAIEPSSPLAWNARLRTAWGLKQLDRLDEAAALLRGLAAEHPERIDAMVTLGDLYRGDERFTEAAEAYGRAVSRVQTPDERHWSLFYARGIAHERLKRWPEAEADFLKALELKPDQPLVLNYLGYSWVEQAVHLDRALSMIQRAVELRPNDGYIVDSLGWALFRLGRFPEATIQLERAVELRPEDPTINDHLGDALWKVGRRAEARFQWQRALSLQPDSTLIASIRSKLDAGLNNAAGTAVRAGQGG